jgi:hypothetical protein
LGENECIENFCGQNLLGNSSLEEPYRNRFVTNVWEIGEQILGMCPDVNWMTVVSKGFQILVLTWMSVSLRGNCL